MKLSKAIFKTFFLSLALVANVHFAYAQSGGIIPNGLNVFLDNNGKPLSSGKVYFYQPSTTTPKTTYSDINLTTPNTNPVVLDAAGRPNGSKSLFGTGNYRQIVQDRNSNVIWDVTTSAAGSGSGGGSIATGDGDLVGTIKPWAGMTAPNQYMFTYGQQISRSTYAALFTAITSSQAIFCNSGSPVLSGVGDTTNFWIGMSVEVGCVSGGVSTIISKTSSSVTLASNANLTENANAIFFPWGRGNGTTTFNLPDFRGLIPVGNNIMGGVASSNVNDAYFGPTLAESSGAKGGSGSGDGGRTLATANLPPYIPAGTIAITNGTITFPNGKVTSSVNGTVGTIGTNSSGSGPVDLTSSLGVTQSTSTATFSGTAQGGTTTAFGILPPVRSTNFIIKVTPDTNSATASGVTSLGGMTGDIACGAGLLCTGNIISVNIAGNITDFTPTIAQLRAMTSPVDGSLILVEGYHSAFDAGGGPFIWNASSTCAEDGGSCITINSAPSAGRFIRIPNIAFTYTPEQFGAFHNGGINDDGPSIRNIINTLGNTNTGGNIQLGCNTIYTISSLSDNQPSGSLQQSLIKPLSNVNIFGCADNSVIKMANNMNTNSIFVWGIFNSGTGVGGTGTVVNNVRFSNFTIDMNGDNNKCGGSGTCYGSNAALGLGMGDNIRVDHIRFINNPGSNDTVFGQDAATPTITNLHQDHLHHFNSCNNLNAACTDWSGDFWIATNATLDNSDYNSAGTIVSSPYEAHGINNAISNLVINNYDTCGIIANEPIPSPTNNIVVGNVVCTNVSNGPTVFSTASTGLTSISIHHFEVNFLSGSSGYGVDACTQMLSSSGPNNNLVVDHVTINSSVTTNIGNNASGICAAYWKSVKIDGNDTTNTQGPGVEIRNHVNGDVVNITNNLIKTPGRTSTTANQRGILNSATGATTSNLTSIMNNSIDSIASSLPYGIENAQNSISGTIFNNRATSVTTGQTLNTGTGVQLYTLPGSSMTFAGIDISQTYTALQVFNTGDLAINGGSTTAGLANVSTAGIVNSFTLAGDCSFSTPNITCLKTNGVSFGALATVTPGAGVAAALAIATGTAGSFVVNGGALGTPSSGNGSNLTNLNGANVTAGTLNANSRECFGTGNNTALTQNSTFFFTYGYPAGTESVVSLPMPQAVSFKNLFVSTANAPASGQTFTLTARKNAADQTLTCAVSSAGTTCNDTTHSFSAAAGDLIAMKLVTSATSGTGAGMNVCMQAVTLSP